MRIVTLTAAGGSLDIVARSVGQKLSDAMGQPVVVENRLGAGGNVGAEVVAKAPADGYTILINSSAHAVNPAIYANLPYDTKRDFIDIVPLAIQPNVLVVAPDSKFNSVQDMVDFARKNPGVINWGHAGVGSGTHLSTEKMIAASGMKVTQIPFKGTPEVVAAVMSKSVDAYWGPISAVIANIKGGKLKALATGGAKRLSTMPELPTVAEAGIPSYEASIWWGWASAGGTPEPILQKINTEVAAILKLPETGKRMAAEGAESEASTIPQIREMIKADLVKWAKVAADAKMPKI